MTTPSHTELAAQARRLSIFLSAMQRDVPKHREGLSESALAFLRCAAALESPTPPERVPCAHEFIAVGRIGEGYRAECRHCGAAPNVTTPPTAPAQASEGAEWIVQVFGERGAKSWEISVVRADNEHGRKSWGWFGADKLLVSHNGGPCEWPITGFVWDQQLVIANELCHRLNNPADKPHTS